MESRGTEGEVESREISGTEFRAIAEALYKKGDVKGAVVAMEQLYEAYGEDAPLGIAKQLCLFCYSAGDYQRALEIGIATAEKHPQDTETLVNNGVILKRMKGREAEAWEWLAKAYEITPDNANLNDAMAATAYSLGRHDEACFHGSRALEIKHKAGLKEGPKPLKKPKLPAFDGTNPHRNIISYSLWGDNPRYTVNALKNITLAESLFPEWTCRFYCDETVPVKVRRRMLAEGADVVLVPKPRYLYEGLFWRFLVANDEQVDYFMCRDADSLLTVKERVLCEQWLESGKAFHVMRDWYTHTELILSGMWGGVAGALPDLAEEWQDYLQDSRRTNTTDQVFLRERVWPRIYKHSLVHDRLFKSYGRAKAPPLGQVGPGRHVGQNHSVVAPRIGHLRAIQGSGRTAQPFRLRENFFFTVTTGRSGTNYLNALLKSNLKDTEVHGERSGYSAYGSATPDVAQFHSFNGLGIDDENIAFWRRKFSDIRFGPTGAYAETSHFLCKAGLIENIEELTKVGAKVDILILERDVFQTAWSLMNRMDFINNGFTWLFYLDPGYPGKIISYETFKPYGMMGSCLWYVLEMRARGAYYRQLYADRKNLVFHRHDLSELTQEEGAKQFLSAAFRARFDGDLTLPGRQNELTATLLGEAEKEGLQRLVAKISFDPEEAANTFIKSGRRLGRIKNGEAKKQ